MLKRDFQLFHPLSPSYYWELDVIEIGRRYPGLSVSQGRGDITICYRMPFAQNGLTDTSTVLVVVERMTDLLAASLARS